jgi:hypothetical protein
MRTQARRTKREAESVRRPSLARTEIVDKGTRARFESELDSALKRRPTGEGKIAGALRAVGAVSPGIRGLAAETASVLLRRGSFERELYSGAMRCLAEADDPRVVPLLRGALSSDEAGGSPALTAACFCPDPGLTMPLAKLASSRQSHLAFGAEVARVVRRESNGVHLSALAPMIKESHRISLCVELFVPLARWRPVSVHVGPALGVLRGAERHLGRWLVLAEVAVKAGDLGPYEEARTKAVSGPSSSRAAWALVAWALAQTRNAGSGTNGAEVGAPRTRPTVELIARLSDRPSADRDTTFLFRMARARAEVARPMLESLAKTAPLSDDVAVRAALYLARDHGRDDMREALVEAATSTRRDDLRGLAAAALWDVGMTARAREIAEDLVCSKSMCNVAWSALIRVAASRGGANGDLVTEMPFRWIQWGWPE